MMGKSLSVGKVIWVFFYEFFEITTKSKIIYSKFTRIESKEADIYSSFYKFANPVIDCEKSLFFLTIFSSMNGDEDKVLAAHIWEDIKSL